MPPTKRRDRTQIAQFGTMLAAQVSMRTLYRRVRLVAIWRRPKLTRPRLPAHDQVITGIVARLAGLPRRAVVLAEDETHLDKAQAGNHASDQHYGPIDRVHVYPYRSSQDRVEAVHVYE